MENYWIPGSNLCNCTNLWPCALGCSEKHRPTGSWEFRIPEYKTSAKEERSQPHRHANSTSLNLREPSSKAWPPEQGLQKGEAGVWINGQPVPYGPACLIHSVRLLWKICGNYHSCESKAENLATSFFGEGVPLSLTSREIRWLVSWHGHHHKERIAFEPSYHWSQGLTQMEMK